MNQQRKPVQGDIISYCYDEENDLWVTAKIRNKVQGYKYYYNVDLEDGGEDGLDLFPPTATDVELWTLRDPEDWNPTEQLLNISQAIPSKQITLHIKPCKKVEFMLYQDTYANLGSTVSIHLIQHGTVTF